MHVRCTPAAAADLEYIGNYLKERHPRYRQRTMRKLYQAIRSLKESPHRGPRWTLSHGYRSIVQLAAGQASGVVRPYSCSFNSICVPQGSVMNAIPTPDGSLP
jgi:plasmid stabilization system protein ParE